MSITGRRAAKKKRIFFPFQFCSAPPKERLHCILLDDYAPLLSCSNHENFIYQKSIKNQPLSTAIGTWKFAALFPIYPASSFFFFFEISKEYFALSRCSTRKDSSIAFFAHFFDVYVIWNRFFKLSLFYVYISGSFLPRCGGENAYWMIKGNHYNITDFLAIEYFSRKLNAEIG